MRILYVTRHFNHSGFLILKRLIEEGMPIGAVLLHKNDDRWRKPVLKEILKYMYYFKCWFYRCQPLRTIRSEEELAKRNGIPIIWTESIKSDEFFEQLKELNPDIIVLGGGWHELIPKRVFSFPRLGCINTHPSLLPEFRGTSITRWQVLHGVEKSGSTIHYVDDTFDTGGVLAQHVVNVSNNVTPQELFLALGHAGAEIMISLLRRFEESGKQESYRVDHNVFYYKYFKKWSWDIEELRINWSDPLKSIHFKVLANTQESFEYRGVYFDFNSEKFFLRKTRLTEWTSEERTRLDTLADSGLYVMKLIGDEICLGRSGDSFGLVLISIQKYDGYYKFRRSYPANKLLKVKVNVRFQI